MFRKFCIFWMFFFVNTIGSAEESIKNTVSLGRFANELITPVAFVGDFITTGSLILGVVCFFWGFIQYLEYKKNPHNATLGSVIAIVLPAIAFVSLPFL